MAIVVDVENGMSRDDLLHLLVTGEGCFWHGNPVYIIGLRPEAGSTNIHHWLVTIKDGVNRREIYVKTV